MLENWFYCSWALHSSAMPLPTALFCANHRSIPTPIILIDCAVVCRGRAACSPTRTRTRTPRARSYSYMLQQVTDGMLAGANDSALIAKLQQSFQGILASSGSLDQVRLCQSSRRQRRPLSMYGMFGLP